MSEGGSYTSTPYRYVIVFLFFLAAGSSGWLWITYAPIAKEAREYFDVNADAVDILALTYPATYIFGTAIATVSFQKLGMRGTFLIATGGMFISATLRVFGSVHYLEKAAKAGYMWALIGQLVGGFVQPLMLNAPAKLVTRWFPKEQRDLFIAMTSAMNIVGGGIGQMISPYFVPDNGGFPLLHLVASFWCGGVFILFVLFFDDFPKFAPSLAAKRQREAMHLHVPVIQHYKQCLSDFNFLLLFSGFGLGLALFNSVLTCVAQITEPYGYSSDQAGNFGAIFLVVGIVSALFIGPILDSTHWYVGFLRVLTIFGFGAIIFIDYTLKESNETLLLVSFGVFGAFVMPLLPISLELGVECTHPIPEEFSTGLLMAMGNVISLPLVLLLSHFNNSVKSSQSGIFQSDVKRLLVIVYGFGLGFLIAFNGPYKRLDQEQQNAEASLQARIDRRGSLTSALIAR